MFYIAQTTFGSFLREKVKSFGAFGKIGAYLENNQEISMLSLRLVPIFPFWFMNIAPSVFGVSFKTFAWTTLVGTIPGCWVYTETGRGLEIALESDEVHSIWSFLAVAMYRKSMLSSLALLSVWFVCLFGAKYILDLRQSKRKQS